MRIATRIASLVVVTMLAAAPVGCGKPENAPSGFVPGGGGGGGC